MDRMLDRRQYDPKMITNIEIMTAYFIDLFYNHLYFEGKKLKVNGSVASITEGYKHALNAFIKSLTNARLYKKAVIGIHQYFINYTSFTTISFSKCVDRLTSNFVPEDYFPSLDNTQKMSILRLVINQAIKNFTKKLVNEHLTKIIDNHKDPDNVRMLQDELVDCFLLEREGVYQRFVSTQTKTNTNETVNRLIAEKMQKEIKNLILEKIQLKKENNALKQIILKNSKELAFHKETTGTLETTIRELNEEIKTLKFKQQNSRPEFFSTLPKTGGQPGFTQVNKENLDKVLDKMQMADTPKSQTSEQSAFVKEEPSYDSHEDDNEGDATIEIVQEPSPAPSTKSSQSTKSSRKQKTPPKKEPSPPKKEKTPLKAKPIGRFSNLEVPKKKRPSSVLGDGVSLDDFY